jgi:hypothetical protein
MEWLPVAGWWWVGWIAYMAGRSTGTFKKSACGLRCAHHVPTDCQYRICSVYIYGVSYGERLRWTPLPAHIRRGLVQAEGTWICMRRSFTHMPPSTFSSPSSTPAPHTPHAPHARTGCPRAGWRRRYDAGIIARWLARSTGVWLTAVSLHGVQHLPGLKADGLQHG